MPSVLPEGGLMDLRVISNTPSVCVEGFICRNESIILQWETPLCIIVFQNVQAESKCRRFKSYENIRIQLDCNSS